MPRILDRLYAMDETPLIVDCELRRLADLLTPPLHVAYGEFDGASEKDGRPPCSGRLRCEALSTEVW